MKHALLAVLFLGGCAVCHDEDVWLTYSAESVISGSDHANAIVVTSGPQTGTYGLTTVTADGQVAKTVALPLDVGKPVGVAGTTSSLWHTAVDGCSPQSVDIFSATLAPSAGTPKQIEIATYAISHAVNFDGQAFQLFWVTSNGQVQHRQLDQIGALGPVHVLEQLPAVAARVCMSAATAAIGTTMLRVSDPVAHSGHVLTVITATGVAVRAWEAPAGWTFTGPDFVLGGTFRARGTLMKSNYGLAEAIATIDLVTLQAQVREVSVDQAFSLAIPSGNNVLLEIQEQVVEVDADYNVVRNFGAGPFAKYGPEKAVTWLGPDVAFVDRVGVTPSSVELVRVPASGEETWRREIRKDERDGTIQVCQD